MSTPIAPKQCIRKLSLQMRLRRLRSTDFRTAFFEKAIPSLELSFSFTLEYAMSTFLLFLRGLANTRLKSAGVKRRYLRGKC